MKHITSSRSGGRILSLLLTAALLIGLFPVPSLADDREPLAIDANELVNYIFDIGDGGVSIRTGTLGAGYLKVEYGGEITIDNIPDSEEITISGNPATPTSNTVYVAADAQVTIQDVNISVSLTDLAAFRIEEDVKVQLTLEGANTLKSADNRPGLLVPGGAEVAINAVDTNQTLSATGGRNAPGIGAIASGLCGTVIINSGSVTATGGVNGAGIGTGSSGGAGYKIVINGGEVTANAGSDSAAIGNGIGSQGGEIVINGGTVKAIGKGGDKYALGAGANSGNPEPTIQINSGSVYADGSANPRPTNGSEAVYMNKFAVGLPAVAGGLQVSEIVVDGAPYHAQDIFTMNRGLYSGELYLWLPENLSGDAYVTVKVEGVYYGKAYRRDTLNGNMTEFVNTLTNPSGTLTADIDNGAYTNAGSVIVMASASEDLKNVSYAFTTSDAAPDTYSGSFTASTETITIPAADDTYYLHWRMEIAHPIAIEGYLGPYHVDRTAPAGVITAPSSTTGSFDMTVTFTDAFSGIADKVLTEDDFTVVGGTIDAVSVLSGAEGDVSRTATVNITPTVSRGGTVTIEAGGGAVHDLAGNASAASSITSVVYTASTGGGGSKTTPTYYTVTFESKGGSAVSNQKVQAGKAAAKPQTPIREGYSLTGWYTDKDCKTLYDFSTLVTGDFTLYAGWMQTVEPDQHTVKPYIGGYPDTLGGTGSIFRPDGEISRAEAAQMLYGLVTGEMITLISGDANPAAFTDIKEGDWYYDAVTHLAEAGILSGRSDGSLEPNGSITRGEFTAMIVRLMGLETGSSHIFSDVPATHWASGYISAAQEAKLVDGYLDISGGTSRSFGPDDDVTRAQAVTIINRMLDREVDETILDGLKMPFGDVQKTHWAYWQIMAAAVEHEI